MNTERFVQQWERRLIRKGHTKGKAEGMAEGKAEGLRVAVLDLCELLGIELRPAERTRLKAPALDELERCDKQSSKSGAGPKARGAEPEPPPGG